MESIYNLRYTKAATKDLEKIMDYLADYGNSNIIINFQKEIDRKTTSVFVEISKLGMILKWIFFIRKVYLVRNFINKGF